MDPRIQRTKNSIIDAFIQLRAKKPLEKITIRELSQLAGINKATFYLHYQDIYDLAHQLLLRILFPDNHNLILADRLRAGIHDYLDRMYPGNPLSPQNEIVLSYMVYGSYCAYVLHQERPEETLRTTAELSSTLQQKYWGR